MILTTGRLAAATGLAALCLLAACGQKGGNATASATAGGSGSAAAPASGPNTPITMADFPRPKAGLWQMTLDDGDGHPATDSSCLSGQAPTMPKMTTEGCGTPTMSRTFTGSIVMDMSCTNPKFSVTVHSVTSGDFQSSITSDSVSTMAMAGHPPQTSKMHIERHWIGPCPPGQKPIDLPDAHAGN